MEMRTLINLVEEASFLTERSSTITLQSGWSTFSGPIEVTMRVWENPLGRELATCVNACFAMSGDPNLRGLAHGGKLYVWDASECTHAGMLAYLGFHELNSREPFNYANPEFCFLLVYAQSWDETGGEKPLEVSYVGGFDVLQGTSAKRWNAEYHRCTSGFLA